MDGVLGTENHAVKGDRFDLATVELALGRAQSLRGFRLGLRVESREHWVDES